MLAMALRKPGEPLIAELRPDPQPGPGEVRLKVLACGVCRTDLHVVDGDLAQRKSPIVPGHEIVGRVETIGQGVEGLAVGQRLGAAWLGETCGRCRYCLDEEENLCDDPAFNGWTRDGGYADHVVVRGDYCFPIPDSYTDEEAAPLLCAGLIGYRSWMKACEGRAVRRLGLYGFGAAAHLLAQLAVWHGQQVYAFTRAGDAGAKALAMKVGCAWAGAAGEEPPEPLDAAIIFAPVGELVPLALRAVRKGGVVVCGGIHMSDIPRFPYALLWEERRLVSVANLTREDGRRYLPLAAQAGVRPRVTTYPLAKANEALADLRRGAFAGAAVLIP
ncbi:MAG TPA: zinc-dependent alcohol dehydrogenase family protein [Caulobacteraceae bacterium]|nr:zinc-dependent alcohol dehydrogenase family protein [Caulobacteraceae bacterium]